MMLGRLRNHLLFGFCLFAAATVAACDDEPGGSNTGDAAAMGGSGGAGPDAGKDNAPGTGGATPGTGGAGGANNGGAGGASTDTADATQADADAAGGAGGDGGAIDAATDTPAVDVAPETRPALATTCATARELDDGTVLEDEPLTVATQNGGGQCGTEIPGPTVYYTATVEAGELLTTHAWSQAGERDWTPFLRVFSQCDQGQCPSRGGPGRTADDGVVLHYANTTDTPQKMYLELSAVGEPVENATFALDVALEDSESNTDCDNAEVVSDGDTVLNQFMVKGSGPTLPTGCTLDQATPALFYSVQLPAHKVLRATTKQWAVNATQPALRFFVLDGGCGASACQESSMLNVANPTNATKTVVFAVAGTGAAPILFDVAVSFTPVN